MRAETRRRRKKILLEFTNSNGGSFMGFQWALSHREESNVCLSIVAADKAGTTATYSKEILRHHSCSCCAPRRLSGLQ